MKLQKGTSLQGGKYIIEKTLGQGGFGITYLAVQMGLSRKVAIKEFFMSEYCERGGDSTIVTTIATKNSINTVNSFRKKFKKEAQNIASLNHPGIVKVYDVFEENNTVYYVMEYLPGGSLKDKLDRQGALSPIEAQKYITEVAEALDYLHHVQVEVGDGITSKMLHLDIKPSNIMLNVLGKAVLVDFGLSKRYDEQGNQTSDTPMGISEGYAPIEQYESGGMEQFTPATDIYALGATLFHMLTGKRPPKASVVMDKGLPELPKSTPRVLINAVQQTMKPQRKQRLQDISEFLELLKEKKIVISKKMTIAIIAAIIVLIIGYVSYDNYTKPRKLYEKAMTYLEGNNPEKWNIKEGIRLMAEAADMGYDEALFQLGLIYFMEEFEIEDEGKAIDCWEKAADKGHVESLLALGAYYDEECEEEKAAEYLMAAAEKGNSEAQWMIGEYYEDGDGGLAESEILAAEWYGKSAAQNNAVGLYNLGYCYLEGDGVEKNIQKGVELTTRSAELGHSDAQFDLATMYHMGDDVERNLEKAKEWYSKSLANGDYSSAFRIGSICEEENNFEEAYKMFVTGAQHNDTNCCWGVGYYHYNGLGGATQDYEEAFKWLTKAANRYHSGAQYYVGYMYKEGQGVGKNKAKALEWFMKAVEYNHPWATLEVAQCYENGDGVERNITTAMNYYKKVSNQTSSLDAAKKAKEHLERLNDE